jgi:hypothetical protein
MKKENYLQVRIYPKGKIKVIKCKKDYIDYSGGDLYNLYNGNLKKPITYDYFITTESRFKKDCNKHFGRMLKEVKKQSKVLEEKMFLINKMISNSNTLKSK